MIAAAMKANIVVIFRLAYSPMIVLLFVNKIKGITANGN